MSSPAAEAHTPRATLPDSHAEGRHELRGALWMVGSAAAFAVMTSLVKLLGPDYSASLQAFVRQVVGMILLAPFIARGGGLQVFATPRPWGMTALSAAAMGSVVLSFYSFQHMPIASASTIAFTRGLWVALMAALFIGERVGPVRLIAVLIGFAGVLLIMHPASWAAIDLATLAAIASAGLAGLSAILLRRVAPGHSTLTIIAWSTLAGLVMFAWPAWLSWRPLGVRALLLMVAMGAITAINQTCYVRSMKLGRATVMSSIENVRLLFTVPIGMALFDEFPPPLAYAGMALVILSALIITWREPSPKGGDADAAAALQAEPEALGAGSLLNGDE